MPEKSDISTRGLGIGAAIVLGGILASAGAAALISARVGAPATGPSRGEPPAIAGPRLQTAPEQDIRAYTREKRARLESYGRVDETHRHIPIERAMRILSKERER
jgi:hypothetical protein